MSRRKLTETVVKSAEYDDDGASVQYIMDTDVRGFGVRMYPSGTKSFIIRYYSPDDGSETLRTLGQHGRLKVIQARKKARKLLGEVAMGEDPFNEEKAKKDAITFAELAGRFIEDHSKVHKKSWKHDQDRYERRLRESWGTRKAKSITYSDVAKMHREIGKGEGYEVEANRTLALVQKMFNWGRSAELVPRDKLNPAADVKKYPEKQRRRTIQKGEMPRVLAAIENEPKPYWRAAFYVLLLTGLRKSELKRCKREDVDLAHKHLHVREAKTASGRRTIPLSTPAVQILSELERKEGNPFVFCGYVAGQPLVNLKDSWARVRQEAKVEDVTIHDIRRTVGSWLAQECSELVVKALLGHSIKGVTARYIHVDTVSDEVRKAVEQYGERLWAMHPKNQGLKP